MIRSAMGLSAVTAALVLGGLPATAQAQEKVRVATTFLGLWDTSQPTFCKERGEFAKAGLDVDIVNTRGGSESVQSVIAGGMDIAFSPGTNAVLAAYMRGAKIKIVGAQFTGQAGAFFYVLADSPIKSVSDLNGKTVAFSRPGGAMESLLLALKNDRKLDLKPVATGAMDATNAMVMTKQIDVGYAVVPNLLEEVEKNKIRVLFSSDDIESQRDLTGRVNIVHEEFLKKRRATAVKFFEVLDGCINWAYANLPEAAKMYAALNKISDRIAERGIGFYKREQLAFGPIRGLDQTIEQAIREKFIDKAPTAQQLADLIDIVYVSKSAKP
ncbi:MAG: ABC transporter substrate-binding protein [Pseudorhodoplanes sp.]